MELARRSFAVTYDRIQWSYLLARVPRRCWSFEADFFSEKKFRLGRKRPNLKFFFQKKFTFKRPTPSGDDWDPLASAEEP